MSVDLVHQPGRKPLSTIPAADEWATMSQIADMLIKGGLIPTALDTQAKVITVLLTGRELGIGVMESCRSIHVVQGKPSLSAELMLALAYKNIQGFEFVVEQSTDQLCKVKARRASTHEWVSITFTRQDAERAGLLGKGVWKQYPQAMLRARAISALCRVLCPDAIRGTYTSEELGRDDAADVTVVNNTVIPVPNTDDEFSTNPHGPSDQYGSLSKEED